MEAELAVLESTMQEHRSKFDEAKQHVTDKDKELKLLNKVLLLLLL